LGHIGIKYGYVGKQREQINIRFADYLSDIKFPTVKSVYDFVCQHLEREIFKFWRHHRDNAHIRGGI
jgi:hypothetical protein